MSYHFLNFKLEDTIKNYIKSDGGPQCDVWGFGELIGKDLELIEPWIGVRCMSSAQHADVQMGESDGNRYFTCEVLVRSHAEDTVAEDGVTVLRTGRDAHADLCGQTFDLFFTDAIQDNLNTAAAPVGNISINQVDQPDMATGPVDRSFVTTFTFRVLCNPTL